MSAIDNAFIRAYTTDTAAIAPRRSAAARPAPASRNQPPATANGAPQTAIPPGSARSAAGNPTAKPARPHFVRPAPRPNVENTVIPAPHIELAAFAHSVTTLDAPRPAASRAVRIDPPAIARHAPHAISLAAGTTPDASASAASELATISAERIAAEATADLNGEPLWPRPAYEVDRFSWPDTCDALIAKIGPQADELAHELLAEAALGRKVIAVSGCAREEGETTLALVLARRLAIAGAKVAIVDANFAAPQLAARLGLVIGIGWETVLALPEKTSLWETMVESLDDRLTLVPLASRSRLQMTGEIAARLAASLSELREAFDIVLVDAGPVSTAEPHANWLSARGNGIDAAILLSDVRSAMAERLSAVSRRLLDANIAPLGVVENFCA
jgi:Mrp family chromosome partitioning ATPase